MNDAIVVSDIHLGSSVCQSKKILELLKLIETDNIETKEIIINGDLFDSWDFRKLRGSHWKVLSKLRSMAKHKHIVWINGNHDGPAEVKFDNFIAKYPFFTKMADMIYRTIQKVDKSLLLAKIAKRNSKTFLRCSQQIMKKAQEYGKKKDVDIVCCGHTHAAAENKKGRVWYYNSGCWTENPCHYLLINNGIVNINQF
jgi:UDP-2,3-diacylglucosamine pyrophosphatase LpxH